MKEVLVVAVVHMVASCSPAFSPVKLQDCYDRAEDKFWDEVEECKRQGLTAGQCPLGDAMETLKEEQEACE